MFSDEGLMGASQCHKAENFKHCSPTQTVIAPEQWFGVGARQNPDILPEHWLAI